MAAARTLHDHLIVNVNIVTKIKSTYQIYMYIDCSYITVSCSTLLLCICDSWIVQLKRITRNIVVFHP